MQLDVSDLREFYTSPLGMRSRKRIREKIRHVWPHTKADRVLGIGFTVPYLTPFIAESECVLSFMSAGQGVINWPREGASLSTLVIEKSLPLPDSSIDRVLLTHSLEMTDSPRDLLLEIWRILSPGGRLLVVVPNRAGLWARIESTPFGYGRPFSRGQLTALMRETMFSPIGWVSALHTPPVRHRSILNSAWLETLGGQAWSRLSGVFLMEATKQLYQGLPARKPQVFSPGFPPILVPSPSPSPSQKR